jgi:hypothetical protein
MSLLGIFSLQVCDLYCGRGVDTENWGEAKIGKYVGVGTCLSPFTVVKLEKNGNFHGC